MRSIIILLLLIGLAVGGWFGYQHYNGNKAQDPLTFIPSNAQVILRCETGNAIRKFTEDTLGTYAYFFGSLGIDQNTLELLKPLTQLAKPVIFSFSENGIITVITEESAENFIAVLPEFSMAFHDKYYVFSNSTESSPPISEAEHNQLQKAFASFLKESDIELVFRSGTLDGFLSSVLATPLYNVVNKQLPSKGWCAFEGGNSNNRLIVNGIGNKDQETENHLTNSDLIRYIPSKTGLTVFDKTGGFAYAISYINYTAQSLNGHENVFVIIENETAQENTHESEYNGIPIALKAIPNADELWFKPEWAAQAYEAQIGNISIFSVSFEQLSKVIDDYFSDDKMQNSSYYKRLADVTSEAGFSLYICPSRIEQPNPFVNFNVGRNSPLNAMVFQSFSEMPHQNFYSLAALHHAKIVDKAPLLWTTTLDTTVLGGPWNFENHYTNEPEILVQDAKFQLYLLNRDGKVLWRKKLNEPIIGDINYIDGFATGKYQILFSTETEAHLIDRNGKNVEDYPISLNRKTHVSPSAIKYDKKSDYRILINSGTRIVNLDANGKEVKGWKKPDLKSPLAQPVIYYSAKGTDYIIAKTEDGKVHFLDRTGKTNAKTIQFDTTKQMADFDPQSSLKESQFVGYDSVGNVYSIKGNGDEVVNNLLPFGGNVIFEVVNYETIKYLTLKGDHLIGLSESFDVLLDYTFTEEMQRKIQLIHPKKGWIALNSKDAQRTYIFNTEGRVLDKMPVNSGEKSILADLDLNKSQELITVRNAKELTAYKISE